MKTLVVYLICMVAWMNVNAQTNATKYKHSFEVSLYSAEKQSVDETLHYTKKYEIYDFNHIFLNMIPVKATYCYSFKNIGLYAAFDVKLQYDASSEGRSAIGQKVFERHYFTYSSGISYSKKIPYKKDIFWGLNSGIAYRKGGELEFLGTYQSNFCARFDYRIYNDFGVTIAPQISYYPYEHWGITLQSKYSKFFTPNSPQQLLTTLNVAYRFGGLKLPKPKK